MLLLVGTGQQNVFSVMRITILLINVGEILLLKYLGIKWPYLKLTYPTMSSSSS